MRLNYPSVADDAGNDAVLSPPYNLTTDQRGLSRKTGDHVDIGACEFGGASKLVNSLNDFGGGSLRNAITSANPSDRIIFAPVVRGRIVLTGGEILIDKSLCQKRGGVLDQVESEIILPDIDWFA